MDFLKERNISTIKQWGGFSIAHFSKLGYKLKDFSSVQSLFNKLLLLPMNHMINVEEVNYISDNVIEFYEK